MTTTNYKYLSDIFPDDHYVGQPMLVDPEIHVNEDLLPSSYYPHPEPQEYLIETEAMYKERTADKERMANKKILRRMALRRDL